MLRTRVVWTGVAGTPWYSNFYWSGNGGSTASAAHAATGAFINGLKGGVVNDLTLTVESSVMEMLEGNGSIVNEYAYPAITWVGTDAGEPLPFQIQMRHNLITSDRVAGRRVRGCSFTGGHAETYQGSGVGPSEANREAIEGVYRDFLVNATPQLVVWSKPFAGSDTRPARAGTVHNVLDVDTSTVWSSLRSRRAV